MADALTPVPGLDRAAPDTFGEGFITGLIAARRDEKFALHNQHLNRQMDRVLGTIGFDRSYVSAKGAHLFDDKGQRYLDLLGGWGGYAVGWNHPFVTAALQEVLHADLPKLAQMDVSMLAGLLVEALLPTVSHWGLGRFLFANSGTEAVEGTIKLAHYSTARPGIVYCEHAFHGLMFGALSLNDHAQFSDGFGSLLPGYDRVPIDDLVALEAALSAGDLTAFIVEPIQGKAARIPSDGYFPTAAALCRKYGTVFVADQIQTGLGRTGKMWTLEHWDAELGIPLTGKALFGGHVPVSVVLCRKYIFDQVFDRMDRAVVHGSHFGKDDMAMAAGLATPKVVEQEDLAARAERLRH